MRCFWACFLWLLAFPLLLGAGAVGSGEVYFLGQAILVPTSAEGREVRCRLEWVLVDSPTITAESYDLVAPVVDGMARIPTHALVKKGVYVLWGEGIARRRVLLVDPPPALADPLSWPFGMIQSRDQVERGAKMAEEFHRVGVRLVKTSIRFEEINRVGRSDDPAAARLSVGLDEFLTRAQELGIRFMFQPGAHYSQIAEPENPRGPFYEGLRRIQGYYKGKIYCWSLGNEVNGGGYSKFTQQQYADVVKLMSSALRGADPAVKLAPGELYSNGGYLTKLVTEPYRDAWDILTVHKVCGVKGTPCEGIGHYLRGLQGLDKPIWDTEVASGCIHGGPSSEGIPQNMRSYFPHRGYDDEHGVLEKSVVRSFCLEVQEGARFVPAYYRPGASVTRVSMFLGYHYNGSGHTLWALRKRYTPEADQPEVTEDGKVIAQVRQHDAQNHKVAGWRTVCDMLFGAEGFTRIPDLDLPDPYQASPGDKYEHVDGYMYRYGAEYFLALWQNSGVGKGDRKVVLSTDPSDRIMLFDSLGNAHPLRNDGGRVKVWVPMNILYLRGFTREPKLALEHQDEEAPYFVTTPPIQAVAGREYWYNAWAYDADVPMRGNDSLPRIRYELVEGPAGMELRENAREARAAGRSCLLHWAPAAPGTYPVRVRAISEHGKTHSVEQSFTIQVTDLASARPRFASPPRTSFARVGWPWTWNAFAMDPGGEAIRYILVSAPAGASVDQHGFVQWTPGTPGRQPLTIRAATRDGRWAEQTLTIEAR